MVILLLVAVVLIVPVHRCTVRNPARGYAKKWKCFKQKETKSAKSPFSSSERTVFVSLVSFVGQRSFQRAAESPSRTGSDTRARAPKTLFGRERLHDFFEARIATQRIPKREQLQPNRPIFRRFGNRHFCDFSFNTACCER